MWVWRVLASTTRMLEIRMTGDWDSEGQLANPRLCEKLPLNGVCLCVCQHELASSSLNLQCQPLKVKGKGKAGIAVHATPSHSYGVSLAISDHTVLPATRHKRTHPAFTPARQAGTRFSYPGGMEGRLSWPRWLVTYRDGLPARRWSPIQVLTGPSVN